MCYGLERRLPWLCKYTFAFHIANVMLQIVISLSLLSRQNGLLSLASTACDRLVLQRPPSTDWLGEILRVRRMTDLYIVMGLKVTRNGAVR